MLTNREKTRILKAVRMVNAVLDAVVYRFYEFSIHPELSESGTCEQCRRYANSVMTRREIEALFPMLEKVSRELWLPHIHPNCNCELRFEEEEPEENVKQEYLGASK